MGRACPIAALRGQGRRASPHKRIASASRSIVEHAPMRWRQLRWCLVGALGCALATPAQGRSPDGSDERRAQEVQLQASKAIKEGRKEDAVERYRAAWELYKNPWFMCERGGLESELGRARDAAQSLSVCIRLLKPEDKRAVGRKVERMLSQARAKVGELTVESNVPDADIAVDGKVVGKLPLRDPIFVDPGSHTVEVRAPGYEPDMRVAVLHAGTSMRIPMRLEPMRVDVAPPAPERGVVEPKEGAISPIPTLSPVLPAPSAKAPVSILARKGNAEPSKEPVRAVVILGGFGLGVAGAAVGAVGLMAAGAARSEAEAIAEPVDSAVCAGGATDPCRKIYDKMNSVVTLTAVGIAGLTLSALGGGLVVYELVRSGPNGTTPKAHVALKVVPGEGALKLEGSF